MILYCDRAACARWLPQHRPVKSSAAQPNDYLFNDSHFHLTNYIQEGIDIHDFLKIMGNKAGRVALFGIPLQQQWSVSR